MNRELEAYRVHFRDGRVLQWWGDGPHDAAHRAGYGSGVFDQIMHFEIVGKFREPVKAGESP